MALKPIIEFWNDPGIKKPENLPVIIGTCKKCDRGENTLVVTKRERSVNHRERNNDKFIIRCFCCNTNYRTDLYTLIQNKEDN